jgi:hypothetical protein
LTESSLRLEAPSIGNSSKIYLVFFNSDFGSSFNTKFFKKFLILYKS